MKLKPFLAFIATGAAMAMLWLPSCNLINPEESVPARIRLDTFDLQLQPNQGSERNKITEIWLYANQNFLGAFHPPVEIPFYPNGESTIFKLRPGIRNNGIASDPIAYPLYTPFEITAQPSSDAVTEIHPVTHYVNGTMVSLNADFETGNDFVFNRDTLSGTNLVRTTDDVFEGEYSGEIILTKQDSFIEVGNVIDLVDLPKNGETCYLEFQYKSEMEMSIAILGIDIEGHTYINFFYVAKPSENWNMLYLDLTNLINLSQLPAYKIIFSAIYPSYATTPEVRLLLDNIKVVHL